MCLLILHTLIILHYGYLVHCQDLTPAEIIASVQRAQRDVQQRQAASISRAAAGAAGGTAATGQAVSGLDRFNSRNNPRVNREVSIGGQVTQRATLALRNRTATLAAPSIGKTPTTLNRRDPARGFSVSGTQTFRNAAASTCNNSRPVIDCDPGQRYRETDGQCNNLLFASIPSGAFKLGAAFTAQGRFLYPDYDDGVASPRQDSVIPGFRLPNARNISLQVHSGTPFISDRYTPFLTHFGQFIDHDIVSTPSTEPKFTTEKPHCCKEPSLPECFNIYFSEDSALGGSCMRFKRAETAPSYFCNPGPRLQQNQRSSFIDGSMVYGWDDEQEARLRESDSGLLITGGDDQLKLEDVLDPLKAPCKPYNNQCFEAGDHRSLETVPLTVMHIIFLRRHNLIVKKLEEETSWSPEVLYQEAKRIVIAELQHVTYNEFLPRVLGPWITFTFGLRPAFLYRESYSPYVDPRTTSGFSVAAYRFGHSLVRNIHDQIGPNGSPNDNLLLKDHFDRLETHLKDFTGGNTEGFARWMKSDHKSRSDGTFVDGLQNNLFRCEDEPNCPMGAGVTKAFDLAALNIQRGRDHGLPSYTQWRYWCTGRRAFIFTPNYFGLSDHTYFEANILRNTYRHVDDIDLFTGGLTETRLPGALLGPTFTCILALQFSNYKRGDRFFYERPDPIMAFTPGQLQAIKQTTLAKILCSTMKSFSTMQVKAMDIAGPGNPTVDCSLLNDQDILAKIPTLWKNLPSRAFKSAAAKAKKFKDLKKTLKP